MDGIGVGAHHLPFKAHLTYQNTQVFGTNRGETRAYFMSTVIVFKLVILKIQT